MFVAVSGYTSSAAADPVRITQGLVEAGFNATSEPLNAEALYLFGKGLAIDSSLEDEVAFVHLSAVPVVAPGVLADFSGVLRVDDVVGAELDGSFALVTAPFSLSFAVRPTPLACTDDGSLLECTGRAPFTFKAELTVTPVGGVPVTRRLVGSGTADGSLFRVRSSDHAAAAVRYVFEPSPVPEPATVWLLSSGLMLAGARVRRRRRTGGTS